MLGEPSNDFPAASQLPGPGKQISYVLLRTPLRWQTYACSARACCQVSAPNDSVGASVRILAPLITHNRAERGYPEPKTIFRTFIDRLHLGMLINTPFINSFLWIGAPAPGSPSCLVSSLRILGLKRHQLWHLLSSSSLPFWPPHRSLWLSSRAASDP